MLPGVTPTSSEPSSTVPTAKAVLRAEALARRDALPAPTRAAAAAAIAASLDREVLSSLVPGAVIALYAPKGSEVDTAPVVERALDRDLVVAYPRVTRSDGNRVLAFHRARAEDLIRGVFGLHQPHPDAPPISIADMSVIVVPGIAFDRSGQRIGWGHGYYDATLGAARSITSVGLAFTCQLIPSVPTTPFDVPVHLVITEDGVARSP